jgi:hypothetical protein
MTAGAITISTVGDLLDRAYQFWASCPSGCPPRQVDLQAVAEKYGRDESYIRGESRIRFRCSRCGAVSAEGFIIPPSTAGRGFGRRPHNGEAASAA